jgi:hypothetical protein
MAIDKEAFGRNQTNTYEAGNPADEQRSSAGFPAAALSDIASKPLASS